MTNRYENSEAGKRLAPVYSSAEIAIGVQALGAQITNDYRGLDLLLITVLKGGLFFLSDLSRAIDLPLRIDFMAVSSYGVGSPGVVRITKDLDDSIEGVDVLVVEDIIDTGLTLSYVLKILRSRNPSSLRVCTLFDKDIRRIVEPVITYRGFRVSDKFLIGYGLDYMGKYRNLADVYSLEEYGVDDLVTQP